MVSTHTLLCLPSSPMLLLFLFVWLAHQLVRRRPKYYLSYDLDNLMGFLCSANLPVSIQSNLQIYILLRVCIFPRMLQFRDDRNNLLNPAAKQLYLITSSQSLYNSSLDLICWENADKIQAHRRKLRNMFFKNELTVHNFKM
jgi:hypothetical protein